MPATQPRKGRRPVEPDVPRAIRFLRTSGDWQEYLAQRKAPSAARSQGLLVVFEAPRRSLIQAAMKQPRRKRDPGLVLGLPTASSLPVLAEHFAPLAYAPRSNCLTWEEMEQALRAPHRADLAIAGLVDDKLQTVTLWRGDLRPLVVPWAAFKQSGSGPTPDFRRFQIIDYGQTIRLGEYEAATDALLYEFDPDYRRRAKARQSASDQGLGPSLRRLRKQRRLKQSDFAPLAARTVARIESGQVAGVRAGTLRRIADRLGVALEELASY